MSHVKLIVVARVAGIAGIVACAPPPPATATAASPAAPTAPAPSPSPSPSATPSATAAEPTRWLGDLDRLEHYLGRHYANLEDSRAALRLDLAALDRTTRSALTTARSELEATEALARFVGAFRDAHLTWSSPVPSTTYDLRLTSDGHKVVVRIAGPNPCGLKPGDEIDSIDGKPALAQLAARLGLGGIRNDALHRDAALRTWTASPFAPRDSLALTVHRGDTAVPCTLAPRAAVTEREPAAPTATTPGPLACAAFGIAPSDPPTLPFLFRPERHAELRPDPAAASDLGSGIVRLGPGRTLGWLRIPLFANEAFPATCASAWTQFRAHLQGSCDDACRDAFLDHDLPRALVATIAARLRSFRAARVSATVIDLTDNGGGVDWTSDIIRMMSPGPLVCPATAFVRDPATVKRLEGELANQRTCERPGLAPPARRALDGERAWTQAVLADAAQPCDLGDLFRGDPTGPACSLLTRKRRSPCDRPPAPPGAPLPGACPVFQPSKPPSATGPRVDGPVYILINRRTGSAAELFAAVLRDNTAATLIGEPTAGAGCGYIDGGGRIALERTGMTIEMPNCARYRADGTNEVDGVQPDVVVPWTVDDLSQFDSYAEKIFTQAAALFPPPRRR
jgi:hypothetical protein